VAIDAGVAFVEVVLWVESDVAIARFDGRAGESSVPGRFNPSELTDEGGGALVVPPHHQRLAELLPHRPDAVVIDASGTLDETYAALLTAAG